MSSNDNSANNLNSSCRNIQLNNLNNTSLRKTLKLSDLRKKLRTKKQIIDFFQKKSKNNSFFFK